MVFNQQQFLEHLKAYLRGMDVDLTHTERHRKDSIEPITVNDKTYYQIKIYGHSPALGGEPRPAYSFTARAYPAERLLVVSKNKEDGHWHLLSRYDGLTPIERCLKDHGLPYNGEDWKVVFL